MSNKIKTKYGTASKQKNGYMYITSRKEGNYKKLLHRLIYEDINNCTLLDNAIIHHIDENKLNNNPDNLILMSIKEHNSLHSKGNQYLKGKRLLLDHKLSISKSRNTSGYYRVHIEKDTRMKQGFRYKYKYYDENGKPHAIVSIDIDKLKEKVVAKGLEWIKY